MKSYDIHPYANIFPLMFAEDMGRLIADIGERGLLEPITVMGDQILDGRNRYRACVNAGVKPRFVEFEGDDPLAFVISKNLARRHLNESQRAMVAAKLANMPKGGAIYRSADLPTDSISQSGAAEMLNVSSRSVRNAKKILNRGAPELLAAVESGAIKVDCGAKIADLPSDEQTSVVADKKPETAIKKVARAKRETALGAKQAALPAKKYGVILADPEWRFEPWSRETGMDRAADNHYPTSCLEVIAARDVASIAADDCVLFLWATAPMTPHALVVLAAWGFDYKSQYVWAKDKPGTGYWSREKHELLLIGTRGDIPCPAPGTQRHSLIEAPRGAHSEKPECFHEMIEAYFPSLPKIELNRRGPPRPGWDAWGNEAAA